MARILSTALLSILLAGALGSPPDPSEVCSSKLNPEALGTGFQWLEWNADARAVFVFAYIGGYHRGTVQACTISDELVPQGIDGEPVTGRILPRCFAQTRSFSEKVEFYVERITEYYQEYPEDRFVPAAYILPMFSDQDAKPLEEIHRMAQTCGLFMTP